MEPLRVPCRLVCRRWLSLDRRRSKREREREGEGGRERERERKMDYTSASFLPAGWRSLFLRATPLLYFRIQWGTCTVALILARWLPSIAKSLVSAFFSPQHCSCSAFFTDRGRLVRGSRLQELFEKLILLRNVAKLHFLNYWFLNFFLAGFRVSLKLMHAGLNKIKTL